MLGRCLTRLFDMLTCLSLPALLITASCAGAMLERHSRRNARCIHAVFRDAAR